MLLLNDNSMLLIERRVQDVKVIETSLDQSVNVFGDWNSKVHTPIASMLYVNGVNL